MNIKIRKLPIEYKLLEWKLIINRQLFEENVIDFEVYSNMEKIILSKMKKGKYKWT